MARFLGTIRFGVTRANDFWEVIRFLGSAVPKEDRILVVKKAGEAGTRPLCHDHMDTRSLAEWEKSIDRPDRPMTDKPNHRGAPQSPRRAGTPSNKEEPTRNPGNGRPPPGRPESRSMVPSKGYRWRFVFLVPVLTVFLLAGFWLYDEYVAQKSEKERIQGTSPSRPFERNSSKFTMETDHYYRLAPFIVPVTAERTQREKFLKLSVSFSLKSGMMSEEIDRKIVTIRSGITEMLLGKSLSDLQSGEGKAAVRREIQGWLDANLGRGAVDDVFIHEFVLL